MMKEACEQMREALSALLDEALPDEEGAAVRAHAESCDACKAWLAEVGAAQRRLAAHPGIGTPPGFDAAVMSRVTAGPLTRLADALDRLICTPTRQIAAAAAATFVLSALILWGGVHVVLVAEPQDAGAVAVGGSPWYAPEMARGRAARMPPLPPEVLERRLESIWPQEP